MMRNSALILALFCAPLVADDRGPEEQKAKLRLELAERILRDAKEVLDERLKLFEAGGVSMAELSAARLHHEAARAERDLRALERDEVKATGKAPASGVTAPKVGDRDFVLQRLEIEGRVAAQRAKYAAQMHERARQLAKRSVMSAVEVLEAEAQQRVADFAMQRVRELVDIRKRFLRVDSGTSAEEAELNVKSFDAAFRMRRAGALLPVIAARLKQIEAGIETGTATRAAHREVERELLRVRVEGAIAQIEFRQVERKLAVR